MGLGSFLRWLSGRSWHRFWLRGKLSAAAALCEDITESDSKERFQQVCRRFFNFLEEQCGFQRDPPRLHEPGYQNPYMVIYRSRSLIIVIEGLSHGARTRMCLIDRDGQLLDIARLVKRRDPKLLKLCSLASGQDEQIPLYAEALWSCAADILDGDLKVVSRIETFGPEFSFGAFSDAEDMAYFLKCHAPRPGSALDAGLNPRKEMANHGHEIDLLLRDSESREDGLALHAWASNTRNRIERGDLMIGILSISEAEKVPAVLRKAAACGVDAAWLDLARWLVAPPIGLPDARAAEQVLIEAITANVHGARKALVQFRWFYRREHASDAERRETFELASRLAGGSPPDPESLYFLGLLTFGGFGTDPRPADAFELQRRAAELGSTDAMFELYVYYSQGIGTPVDTAAAWAANERAAHAGHPRATYNMGAFYATGNQVPRDLARAVEWYQRSSDAGNARATATLARMYATGEGVDRDLDCARELFDLADAMGLDVDELRRSLGL